MAITPEAQHKAVFDIFSKNRNKVIKYLKIIIEKERQKKLPAKIEELKMEFREETNFIKANLVDLDQETLREMAEKHVGSLYFYLLKIDIDPELYQKRDRLLLQYKQAGTRFTINDVRRAVPHFKKNSVYQYLQRLVDKGRLLIVEAGHQGKSSSVYQFPKNP